MTATNLPVWERHDSVSGQFERGLRHGRTLTKAYDANYNIDAVSDSAASNPLSEDFTVDAGDRITGLSERTSASAVVARTYSYDGLDRLTGQKTASNQVVEAFTYDATGNRQTKTVGSSTTSYGYPTTSHRLTSVGNKSRTYDANGNTAAIGSGGQAPGFVYDDRNRLRDYKLGNNVKASYRYNGKGEQVLRIDSTTPANSRQYVYDEAGHLLGEYTTAGVRIQEYVWLDDTLVGILSPDHDGSTYQYVETDHLGTPRAVIHPTKNTIVWRWNLNDTTFGDHAPLGDPDSNGITYTLALRYPGQRADPITGLNYNYFRDYEAATGRYVESDPLGFAGGLSTYSFASSNTFSRIDPLGLFDGVVVSVDPALRDGGAWTWDTLLASVPGATRVTSPTSDARARTTIGWTIDSRCAQNVQGLWAVKSATISVYFTVYMGKDAGKVEWQDEAEHIAEFTEWANGLNPQIYRECSGLSDSQNLDSADACVKQSNEVIQRFLRNSGGAAVNESQRKHDFPGGNHIHKSKQKWRIGY